MKIPPRTKEDLEYGLKIILENPYFEASVHGFLINVSQSLSSGLITREESDYFARKAYDKVKL